MTLKRRLLLIFIGLFGGACVSIKLPPGEARPADYDFTPPPSPFEKSRDEGAVKSWVNRKNGNSISILSNCNNQVDPSIATLQKEIVSSVESPEVLGSARVTFNRRSALVSTVEGKMDGVPVKIRFLILKKNNCHYNLSYIGVKKAFDNDVETFNKFLKDFKAP